MGRYTYESFLEETAQQDRGQGLFELESERMLEVNLDGRVWTISKVSKEDATLESLRFWQRCSPEERVDAMADCLLDWLKLRGIDEIPRLRRVSRKVGRS